MATALIHKDRLLAAFDQDTRNFIDAAGLNNDANLNVDGLYTAEQARMAVHCLVSGLKAIGVWDKIKAAWIFVGGNDWQHALNLKDPRDLDAAFRITWFGGITHNGSGVKGNGTTGYGDTHFRADLELTNNSNGASFYTQELDLGVNSGSIFGASREQNFSRIFRIRTFFSGIGFLGDLIVSNNTGYRGDFGNGKGAYSLNRTAVNTMNLSWGGLQYPVRTSVANPTFDNLDNSLYVLAEHNTSLTGVKSPIGFSNKTLSLLAFHQGLTPNEASSVNQIITFYQGLLNRK